MAVLQKKLCILSVISGLLMMLCCCIIPLIFCPSLSPSYLASKAAHHQFSHNGEFLIALGLAFPFVDLSPIWLKLCFVLINIGTWSNPLAYSVVSFSGETNELMGPDIFEGNLPMGQYSALSANLLLLCVYTIVPGIIGLIIGLIRNFSNPHSKTL